MLVDPQVETSPADSPPSAPEVVQQQQKAKVEQQAERIQDREHREVKAVVVLNGVMVVLAFVLVVVGFASWKRRRLTQDLKRPPTTAENSIYSVNFDHSMPGVVAPAPATIVALHDRL